MPLVFCWRINCLWTEERCLWYFVGELIVCGPEEVSQNNLSTKHQKNRRNTTKQFASK
ncbi:14177_t:CDS:2, partial [Gigaspora rosea]